MTKKYKKKLSLKTIDDFIHAVSQMDAPQTGEPVDEFLSESPEETQSEMEQVELSSRSYIINSPNMDDDFLGDVKSSSPILENENYNTDFEGESSNTNSGPIDYKLKI